MQEPVTNTLETDHQLWCNHREQFIDVLTARRLRKQQAFNDYLGEEYKTRAKFTVNELQTLSNKFQIRYDNTGDASWLTKKEEVDSKISAGDYATENTPEWTYRQNLKNHISQFIWPSQDELMTREIEKQQLLQLLQ